MQAGDLPDTVFQKNFCIVHSVSVAVSAVSAAAFTGVQESSRIRTRAGYRYICFFLNMRIKNPLLFYDTGSLTEEGGIFVAEKKKSVNFPY